MVNGPARLFFYKPSELMSERFFHLVYLTTIVLTQKIRTFFVSSFRSRPVSISSSFDLVQFYSSTMATVLIDKLLQACIKQGASDIHIVVGQPPVFRLHGRMRRLETKVLEPDDTVQLMKSIAPERCQRELQESGSSDFGFAFGTQARFRVSIFKQRGFISMVLRQIPTDKLTPEQLGVPESVVKLCLRPRGLILVTGPTGFASNKMHVPLRSPDQ